MPTAPGFPQQLWPRPGIVGQKQARVSWGGGGLHPGSRTYGSSLELCNRLQGMQDQARCCGAAVLGRARGALPEAERRCSERCGGLCCGCCELAALGGGPGPPPPGCATSPSCVPTPWQSLTRGWWPPHRSHSPPMSSPAHVSPPLAAACTGPGCVYQNRGEKLPSDGRSPNPGGTFSPLIR